MGLIWDKKTMRYVNEEDVYMPQELAERNKKKRAAMLAADARVIAQEKDKWARGYCPRCRLLLPVSGRCDCGYVRPSQHTVTGSGTVRNGYVNPMILNMYK